VDKVLLWLSGKKKYLIILLIIAVAVFVAYLVFQGLVIGKLLGWVGFVVAIITLAALLWVLIKAPKATT